MPAAPEATAAVPRAALRTRSARAVVVAAAATLLPVSAAVPAEWFARSRLSLQSSYDDNVRLSTDDAQDAFAVTVAPQLLLGARSPNVELTLDTRLDLTRYVDEPELDSNDQLVRLKATHVGRRGTATLAGSFIRDTVRDDDSEDDSQQLGSERRITGSIDPSFSYRLSQRQTLLLSGGYQRRIYPNADGASSDGLLTGTSTGGVADPELQSSRAASNEQDGRQNSDRFIGQLFWQYALTSRTVVGGGPAFLYLDQPRQDLSQASVQALVQHTLTPRLRLDARGGPSVTRTDSKVQGQATNGNVTTFFKEKEEETSLGFVADVGVTWLPTRRTQVEARYARAVEPSGSEGEAVTRDTVTLRLDHELTRTVGLFLSTSFQQQERVSSDTDDEGDRKTVRFEPGVRWSLTPDLDLSLRYRLRYREFDGTGDDATSNAVLLRLDLKLPDLRTSW
jgi:hypothetical protein